MKSTLFKANGAGRIAILWVGLLLIAFNSPRTLPAQEITDEVKPVQSWREGWGMDFTPYAWMLGLDGDLTVKGNKSSVDLPFHDILEDLNGAIMGEVRLRKNRVGFFFNTLYAVLEEEADAGSFDIDFTLDFLIMSFGVDYSLGPYDLGDWPCELQPRLTIQPLAGGRYTYLKGDIDLNPVGSADQSVDWVDPIVGVRTILDLTQKWNIILGGNLGGFDTGGSDFSWEATGLLGYRFKMCGKDANAMAGYRALYMDYSEGSGTSKFSYDATLSGPVLGLNISF